VEVLIVTIAVSLALVVAALLFLAQRVKQGDVEHGDRLSLLPLEDDAAPDTARDGDAESTVQDDSRGRERPKTEGKTPGPRHQA
jgi:hypothetical protein